jgi:hypothetical protein
MTAFSQRDPRWASDQLGNPAEYSPPYTLAQAGCLLTAAASMLADFGVPTDPHRLNAWLRDHAGFSQGCLFRFYAVTGLGADLVTLARPPATPRPAEIADALNHGAAVLAEIIPKPEKPDRRHWIRILSPIAHDWHVMDPWQLPGAELITLTAAYPTATLRSVAIYKPNPARIIPLTTYNSGLTHKAVRTMINPDGTQT